ncbi:MAG: radical SAM family heme chaperone HemW, partial [Deltaproteobacteria bacterium]|nr:radical SAM family heme chaperone HemW [Deltaproteobacteria bacterium]
MTDTTPAAGLYIHVPFCKSKCPYCDFFSSEKTARIPQWLTALKQELHLYKARFSRFDTLYLGGGTPSLLTEQELADILKNIYQTFSITDDAEITIEVNPNDLTLNKARALFHLGINRISLGVQSFDDTALRLLGRRHTAQEAIAAIAAVRDAGGSNLSIDLMYALPGQTLSGWQQTLQQAVSFNPEHLSCYQLTIKNDTPFQHLQENGAFAPASEAEEETFFLETRSRLAEAGYSQYEISSFARAEKLFSRHNRKYWQHTPYLGLGPSAHSFDGTRRWWNSACVQTYCKQLSAGRLPVEDTE